MRDTAGSEEDAGSDEDTRSANGITARYQLTDTERVLTFEREAGDRDTAVASVAQNVDGYAMLMVRAGGPAGDEVERYYGFDMALDHAAELLGVDPADLPVPEAAADMGM